MLSYFKENPQRLLMQSVCVSVSSPQQTLLGPLNRQNKHRPVSPFCSKQMSLYTQLLKRVSRAYDLNCKLLHVKKELNDRQR